MAVINDYRDPKGCPDPSRFLAKFNVAKIDIKALNSTIYNHGVRVLVYTSLPCPRCFNTNDNDFNCPLCHGTSFVDVNPVQTYAIIQEANKKVQINVEDIGTNLQQQFASATFLSGIDLTFFSKVELLDYTNLFTENVIKQAKKDKLGDVLKLTGQQIINFDPSNNCILFSNPESLFDIQSNDILVTADGEKYIISGLMNEDVFQVYGDCSNLCCKLKDGVTIYRPEVDRLRFKAHSVNLLMDDQGKYYQEGQDFILTRNGDIGWISNHTPAEGSTYAISYNTLVAYRAYSAMHGNRFLNDQTKKDYIKPEEAPQQWLLRKLYLFSKRDEITKSVIESNNCFMMK